MLFIDLYIFAMVILKKREVKIFMDIWCFKKMTGLTSVKIIAKPLSPA